MSVATMRQASEIIHKLSGNSRDNIQKLIDNWDLVAAMMRGDPRRIDRQAFASMMSPPATGLFSTPTKILERFAFYAGVHSWPVRNLLDQLESTMPARFESSLSRMLTLDIWLGDLPTTFEALAGWIGYEQQKAGLSGLWRWDEENWGRKLSDPEHLRLLDPDRYGSEPSVKWAAVDPTANWDRSNGTRPVDVRDPATSPGLEVMAAFAVHPNYPPAIDYENIPGVWLPGLRVKVPEVQLWTHAPFLHWRSVLCSVDLDVYQDGGRHNNFAVPERRDLHAGHKVGL